MTTPEPLVHLQGVSKAYKTQAEVVWAVRDADLRADAGEFVCIHGPSGSGKSTLLSLIVGLITPDAGDIRVAGLDVGHLSEDERAQMRLRSVGVVFQDHALIEDFTAAENVALPVEAQGVDSAEALEHAAQMLARVGLDGLGARWPRQLSGGQQQRVGIARALAGNRTIIVADEPTGALDSKTSAGFFDLLTTLCRAGTLVVVCSHDPMCRSYADTVYEMIDGRLGPPGPSAVGRRDTA